MDILGVLILIMFIMYILVKVLTFVSTRIIQVDSQNRETNEIPCNVKKSTGTSLQCPDFSPLIQDGDTVQEDTVPTFQVDTSILGAEFEDVWGKVLLEEEIQSDIDI